MFTEQYDELGLLKRTCSGDVSVTKCEGFCNSQVQPSVVTPTGFLKVIIDCKRHFLKISKTFQAEACLTIIFIWFSGMLLLQRELLEGENNFIGPLLQFRWSQVEWSGNSINGNKAKRTHGVQVL